MSAITIIIIMIRRPIYIKIILHQIHSWHIRHIIRVHSKFVHRTSCRTRQKPSVEWQAPEKKIDKKNWMKNSNFLFSGAATAAFVVVVVVVVAQTAVETGRKNNKNDFCAVNAAARVVAGEENTSTLIVM